MKRINRLAYDYHVKRRHRLVWRIPLVLLDQVLGFFCLSLNDDRPFDEVERESVATLAQQLVLALELTRLGEQAREVAVTREREQAAGERASQLERANALLSRTIEALAAKQSPDAFLEATLRAIAATLNASTVTLWRWPGDGRAYLHRVLEGNQVLSGDQSSHPDAGRPVPIAECPWAKGLLSGKGPTEEVVAVSDRRRWTAAEAAHRGSQGVHATVNAAIRNGGLVTGTFSAWLSKDEPDPEQMALVRSLATQAALALELTRLTDAVRAGAALQERNWLAGEIHDTLAQGFAAVLLQAEGAEETLRLAPNQLPDRLEKIKTLARTNLAEARRSVRTLRAPASGQTPEEELPVVLRRLTASIYAEAAPPAAPRCKFRLTGTPRPLPPVTERELARIAQEALRNAVRHARATRITLTLRYTANQVELQVADDGCGLPEHAANGGTSGNGVGLHVMRHRAARLGGELSLAGTPRRGTVVTVRVPVTVADSQG